MQKNPEMIKIFEVTAPRFWEKSISVIPLKIADKRPIYNEWSKWSDEFPPENVREHWLKKHPAANIGVVLGKQSRLVFIDIDTEDENLVKAINKVLPPSPWRRVGAKGCIYAYKYSGEASRKISQKGNSSHIVEILSTGNQAVLPPSIHPVTLRPYEQNVDLLDVYYDLPTLPKGVYEQLRSELSKYTELSDGSGGGPITSFTSIGGRDSRMTSLAGLFALDVQRGNMTLKEALDKMSDWVQSCVLQVEGDVLDLRKALGKIIEFLSKDVLRGRKLPVGWDLELSDKDKKDWGINFSEDCEKWSMDKFHTYMMEEFSKCQNIEDPNRYVVIDKVLKKIVDSDLSSVEEGSVIKNLKMHSLINLPISYYNKELKKLRSGPILGVSHSEIAIALKEIWEERFGKLSYSASNFWRWNGIYWEKVLEDEIWEVIIKIYGDLDYAKKASDHKGIIQILSKICDDYLERDDVEAGVNFANGFLNKNMILVPHQPEQGMTYALQFSYKPELGNRCLKFFKYLEDSWGHQEDFEDKKTALGEAMAATLFGVAPVFQRGFLLYGVAGSGKSVLGEIVQNLVHEEVRSCIPPEDWYNEYKISMLYNKLLNFAGEVEEKRSINGTKFKTIISGEPITAREIYKTPFVFKPRAAHWIAGNYLPKTSDGSDGFNRRWLIFYFDKPIEAGKKIAELGKIIASDEIEAIVAWAISKFPNLVARGEYTLPSSHRSKVDEMASDNNPIRGWIRDKIEFRKGVGEKPKDLYSSFFTWQTNNFSANKYSQPDFIKGFEQVLTEKNQFVWDKEQKKYMGVKII